MSTVPRSTCCCGTIHIVIATIFFAALTIGYPVGAIILLDTNLDSYKIVFYLSLIIPAIFVMAATVNEEPLFMMPAIIIDVLYSFFFLASLFTENAIIISYQKFLVEKFNMQDANNVVLVSNMLIVFVIAITMWKLNVYLRCAEYLDGLRKKKNAEVIKTSFVETSQPSAPVYPNIV